MRALLLLCRVHAAMKPAHQPVSDDQSVSRAACCDNMPGVVSPQGICAPGKPGGHPVSDDRRLLHGGRHAAAPGADDVRAPCQLDAHPRLAQPVRVGAWCIHMRACVSRVLCLDPAIRAPSVTAHPCARPVTLMSATPPAPNMSCSLSCGSAVSGGSMLSQLFSLAAGPELHVFAAGGDGKQMQM